MNNSEHHASHHRMVGAVPWYSVAPNVVNCNYPRCCRRPPGTCTLRCRPKVKRCQHMHEQIGIHLKISMISKFYVGLLFFEQSTRVGAFSKRGVTQSAPVLCNDLSSLNGSSSVGWFTDWTVRKGSFENSGCGGDDALHPGIDYVPQYATHWALNPPISRLDLRFVGRAHFVIGYNEPDHSGSYIDPAWAASQWNRMEQLQDLYGFKIVAPCVANYASGKSWMVSWQDQCTHLYGRRCRTDFVCVHSYYHVHQVDDMLTMLNIMHEDWKQPIWITEFACPPFGKPCSADENLKFMETAVPKLDSLPYIYRYAWFIDRQQNSNKNGGALLEGPIPTVKSPQRTALGNWYHNFISIDNFEPRLSFRPTPYPHHIPPLPTSPSTSQPNVPPSQQPTYHSPTPRPAESFPIEPPTLVPLVIVQRSSFQPAAKATISWKTTGGLFFIFGLIVALGHLFCRCAQLRTPANTSLVPDKFASISHDSEPMLPKNAKYQFR